MGARSGRSTALEAFKQECHEYITSLDAVCRIDWRGASISGKPVRRLLHRSGQEITFKRLILR